MKMGEEGTDSVLVVLVVPTEWKRLSVDVIARKLRANEPYLSHLLATEVKRWAGIPATDLTALQGFIDARTGKNDAHTHDSSVKSVGTKEETSE